jgi:hypothetical protein
LSTKSNGCSALDTVIISGAEFFHAARTLRAPTDEASPARRVLWAKSYIPFSEGSGRRKRHASALVKFARLHDYPGIAGLARR